MRHMWGDRVIDKMLEQLVEDNMQAARNIARKVYLTATHALEQDELESIAYMGLVQAANTWFSYCSTHSHPDGTPYSPDDTQFFIHYAKHRIRGAIFDHFRDQDWIPRTLRAKSRMLRKAGEDQGASVEEMALKSGLTEKEVLETILAIHNKLVSIEGEQVDVANSQTIESNTVTKQLLNEVVISLKTMEPVVQAVIVLHYVYGQQLKQVAKLIGITHSRASNIHIDTVLSLRDVLMKSAREQGLDVPLT